jgi:MFS family permease
MGAVSPRTDEARAAAIVGDDAARAALQRRTLVVVVAAQVLGGAGLAAGITVGALLARELLGSDDLAGLPTALFTLGSALTAYLVGRVTQRHGRRPGIGLGFLAGGLGAVGVVLAAVTGDVVLLFVSLFVYGAGTATNLQARYAGTDLADPARRGRAISVALVATTFGAVAGPNLVEPLGALATAVGVPALAGPFLLAAVAFLAAGTVLVAFLRPDPFLVARHLDRARTRAADAPGPGPVGSGVVVGATVMVLTQIAMIAIMTMTPVHMRDHGHGLGEVGLVIGVHVAAMFLPSLVTGVLVDRVGRIPVAVAAGATLLAAGLLAAVAPAGSLPLLVLALALLGLGWNLGLISGTALLVDATVPGNRGRVQGTVDVLVALAGAGGGAVSGLVVAGSSFATLSLAGGVLSLLVVPALLWTRRADRAAAGPARHR